MIQAFAPSEVNFEEAHQLGKELADKVLEGKYSYIVTTHIDKGHVHNHIIFYAADMRRDGVETAKGYMKFKYPKMPPKTAVFPVPTKHHAPMLNIGVPFI